MFNRIRELLSKFMPLRKLLAYGLAIAFALWLLCDVGHVFNIRPPAPPTLEKLVTLEQQWSADDAHKFHFRSQGTMIMPHAWFMALEQPELRVVTGPDLVSDRAYLERFGFIYEKLPPQTDDKSKRHKQHTKDKGEKKDPDGDDARELPIGFAISKDFVNPLKEKDKPKAVIGLTCAACHTGQINYKGTGIRIEGGSGNVDLGLFQKAVGRALAFTLYTPTRFSRFADRVLGERHTTSERDELLVEFKDFVESKLHQQLYADKHHLYDLQGGNGRTDALALIGNRAFQDQANPENLAVTSAPVNFPPIWDAPWFDWVQYNASIGPPMVRNIGEALGVGALVVTKGDKDSKYKSTVDIEGLHEIESQLAGPRPFAGLAGPDWPADIFGPLNDELVQNGQRVYADNCQHCHPLATDLHDSHGKAGNEKIWTKASGKSDEAAYTGPSLIKLKVKNLRMIGTDPAQALNMHKRVVKTVDGIVSEGAALMRATDGVRQCKYKELDLSPEKQREFDSYRPMLDGAKEHERAPLMIADNLGYRSRPLNGIWATAPFLHNGSVPNLYELLLPAAQRSKTFYAGGREFDPVHVGLLADSNYGVFKFDTTLAGNSNSGHEFRNLELEELEAAHQPPITADRHASKHERWAAALGLNWQQYHALKPEDRAERIHEVSAAITSDRKNRHHCPPGVLGPEFKDCDRWAVIEYVKSLKSPRGKQESSDRKPASP